MQLLRHKGFTVIELVLALAVGTLVLLGAWEFYGSRLTSVEAQKTVAAIQELTIAANEAYSTSSVFSSDPNNTGTTPNIDSLAAIVSPFPEAVVVTGSGASTTYSNYWGGSFQVTATGSDLPSGLDNDLLTFTLTNVPTQACTAIVSSLAPGMYDTTVNGTLVGLTPAATTTAINRNQVRYDQMLPLCNNANNRIVMRTIKDFHYAALRYKPTLPTLTAEESAAITTSYNRYKTALANREAAQAALP